MLLLKAGPGIGTMLIGSFAEHSLLLLLLLLPLLQEVTSGWQQVEAARRLT
jgi:hypothetical protein